MSLVDDIERNAVRLVQPIELRRIQGGQRLHAVPRGDDLALCGARSTRGWTDLPWEGDVPDCKRCASRMPQLPKATTSTTYGYVRVSTGSQTLGVEAQLTALATHADLDVGRIVAETASGGVGATRPVLTALLEVLQRGDTLVVARLDRLGRSVRELARIVDELGDRGVRVVSVVDQVDTSSAHGRLLTHVLAAAAEYELELIRDRTREAVARARESGVHCGRPYALGEVEVRAIRAQVTEGVPIAELARDYHVSESTIRRRLAEPPSSQARRGTAPPSRLES